MRPEGRYVNGSGNHSAKKCTHDACSKWLPVPNQAVSPVQRASLLSENCGYCDFWGLPSPLPKNRGGLQPVPQSEQPSSPPEPPPAYNPPKLLRSPTPFRSAKILSLPLTLNRSFPQVCPIMRTPAPRPVADMTCTHCSCSRTGIHPLASRSAITAIVARPITMTAQPINETKRAK